MAGAVSELLSGTALLGRGMALVLRRPRLALLGAIPPLITSVLFTLALVGLSTQLDGLVAWLTPFAADWGDGIRLAVRVAVGLSLVAGSVLLMVVTFSALTLALGGPVYDRISESVDAELSKSDPGSAPMVEPSESWTRSAARAATQSLTLIAISLAGGVVLFASGFVPVLGQLVVPVVSAAFGGWMLSMELVGSAFERRGHLRLRDRRAALRRRRMRVLGFAVPTFVLLAVPFVAVVVFPAATAAATLLARDLLCPPEQRSLPAVPRSSRGAAS
ncbi:MAG TPA: EI24 domain-containing protein [Propionibacteriaceae bacterium]|nr:EI24 domain-containing protein [Propionibacteriaceae bacterium]